MTVSTEKAEDRSPDPIIVITVDKSQFENNLHVWFTVDEARELVRQLAVQLK
jgi:hypothetical protein